jgi:hypothetical protein
MVAVSDTKNELGEEILVSSDDFGRVTESEEKIPLSGNRRPRKLLSNSLFSSSSEGKKNRKDKNHDKKSCCFSFRNK